MKKPKPKPREDPEAEKIRRTNQLLAERLAKGAAYL